jgi:hypothetical protein
MHLLNYFDCDTFTQNPNIFKMTTHAMKNVEKAFTSHGKSLDENGNEIKSPEKKNVDRGFEKAGSPDSAKESGHEGVVHPGRPQQEERFGDQYRKVSLLDLSKQLFATLSSMLFRDLGD